MIVEGDPAGRAVHAENSVVAAAAARSIDVGGIANHMAERVGMAEGFVAAYGQYCCPVESLDDLKLAPFQILAGEGGSTRCVTTCGTSRYLGG